MRAAEDVDPLEFAQGKFSLSRSRVNWLGRTGARRKFPADDRAFANRVPMIVAERAGFADDTMARNNKRDGICADRAADGARCL